MDEHKSQANLLHLFLEYLAVGQYELARLVYLQERDRDARFKRVVKLLACGFRPQEWIYTPSCPSASHLVWWSARLLLDSVPDSLAGPRLLLGGNALLQQEAGVLVQEQFRFATPANRLDVLVSFLLRDEARLCHLLCAPDQQPLRRMVELVWEDLQGHFKSDEDCARVVTGAIDQLVARNRAGDAAALYARSTRVQVCPESLAKLAGGEENARVMAKAMLEHGCLEPAKHASLFRYRLGGERASMHAVLLGSLRQGHANWFSALVDDPFACSDALPVLKAFHVLTTPGRKDFLQAVAVPALDATSLQRSMHLHVNQLAYESICGQVNELVACGPSSPSLLTPLLLLSVVGLGEEPRVSSHALFQTVLRLFEHGSEWLSPSQRNEVLSVCMACWVNDPSLVWPAEFNCTAREEVWLVRFLAVLDLSLVGPFLRFVRHPQVKTEYQLRLQVAALVADVRERVLLEHTAHELVAVCFAHRQWELAIDVLQFFSKHSPVASPSPSLSLLLHEAQVMQALQRQQGDFAFGAADQQDFEFQRHKLVFTEWESGRKREQTARLVEANFKSADLFLVACAQSQLDALQVLVEYHMDNGNNQELFHELALAVESQRPFPTLQSAQAFRALVGLESHPIYSVLCGEDDDDDDDDPTTKRLRNSVYSLQEDVEDRLRKAAKCLGFELHLSPEWAITGFALDGADGADGEINPNAAVDALRGVEHSLAVEFCTKLQAHLDHNAMASSYERWMLTEAMDLLQDNFTA